MSRALTSGRRRRTWLLPVLAVLLVAVPILEVWLLIQVGQLIGVGSTVLVLVLEAVLGSWLVRREGRHAWHALTSALESGRMPADELTDAALVLVGGVLLVLPGFATDVVGALFLLPFSRPLPRRLLRMVVVGRLRRLGVPGIPSAGRPRRGSDDVVPGETVEDVGGVASDRSRGDGAPMVIAGEVEDGPRPP